MMLASCAPVIHIGLPKTGTTTLQRYLFGTVPSHLNISRYPLGRGDSGYSMSLAQISTLIWGQEREAETVIQCLAEKYELAKSTSRLLVWSDEKLTYVNAPLAVQQQLAARLRRAVPDARILLTIRSQFSMLVSTYRQSAQMMYAALGWPRDVPHRLWRRRLHFSDWLDALIANPDQTYLSLLDYSALHDTYADQFGASNVLVLPMERFAQSAPYLSGLLDISESAVTTALQNRSNESRRKLSSYWGGWALEGLRVDDGWPAGGLVPQWRIRQLIGGLAPFVRRMPQVRTDMSTEQRNWLREHFAASNKSLAARKDLDLESLGYPWQ